MKNVSKIFEAAKYDWTTSKVVKNFSIWPEPGQKNLNVTLQKTNWVASCYLVNTDMIEEDYLKSMQTFIMLLNEGTLSKQNVTVELKLQGRNIIAHRNIEAHYFYHLGDVLKLDRLSKFLKFRVNIKKRVLIEGEPGTMCRNYPNSDFDS